MTCSLCDSPLVARGYCRIHYQRWRRNGDPNVVRSRGSARAENPSYRRVHKWLVRERGRASEHPCTDCGALPHKNNVWAFDSPRGYSTDIWNRYRALCRSCHHRADYEPRLRSADGRFAPYGNTNV